MHLLLRRKDPQRWGSRDGPVQQKRGIREAKRGGDALHGRAITAVDPQAENRDRSASADAIGKDINEKEFHDISPM
jgi:hypothetical protein